MAPLHLISLALLSFLIVTTIHPSHSSPNPVHISKIPENGFSDKVNLNLYYETLCPYCGNFIVNDLVKVFTTDLYTITNLRLVPWGNANLDSSKTITCQHGDDECYLNTIHACAINIWPDTKKHFDFIRCIENQTLQTQGSQNSKKAELAWTSCSKKLNLDQNLIQKCYDNGLGTKLSLQYGNETDNLNPKHEYVPWVTVNKKPLFEHFQDYVDYVCKAYKGKNIPEACKKPHSSIAAKEEENGIQSVCYSSEGGHI